MTTATKATTPTRVHTGTLGSTTAPMHTTDPTISQKVAKILPTTTRPFQKGGIVPSSARFVNSRTPG